MQTTPKIVGSCCVGLKVDWFQTLRNNFQQHLTPCNRVCKRTQRVTSNNVRCCWQTISGPFARGLTLPYLLGHIKSKITSSVSIIIENSFFNQLLKRNKILVHKAFTS